MSLLSSYQATEPEFRRGLEAMAMKLGLDVLPIAGVMYLESGIDPAAVNTKSGATGLIQFMPRTAELLGTTVGALRGMSRAQQLPYVEAYFKPIAGRIRRHIPGDYYMAVFNPTHIGKPLDFVLYAKGTKGYEQNRALDRDKSGAIEVRDVTRAIENLVFNHPPLPLAPAVPGGNAPTVPLAPPVPMAGTLPPELLSWQELQSLVMTLERRVSELERKR